MKVPHDEGVANRIGPEPCVGAREGVGEASVGECVGQPLSRESLIVPGADVVRFTEGDMESAKIASARSARRVEEPGMRGSFLYGNREVSGLACGWTPHARVGKARSHSRRCTNPRSLTPP